MCLKKNAINLILGSSGSGKSSLAYDTIAQIGLHKLGAMCYDGVNEPEYKVDSYENMVVTIPIKQTNNNNNIRSTVGTYFSISPCLEKIYSSLLELPYDYFVLNKSENICSVCLGVGNIKKLDPHKIVDYDKKIEEVPIRCWRKNKDFYSQILHLFCAEKEIPYTSKFCQLSEKQKQEIMYPVIGIDEPFKGLGNEEIYMVIKALEELVAKNKTIVVGDHEEKAFRYFVNHIYLINHDGILTTNDSL